MATKFNFPYTCDDSFTPNLTTKLIYDHARTCLITGARDILEVGCGCGVISLGLAIEFGHKGVNFSLSDIAINATNEAKQNFLMNSQRAEIRSGDILTPWEEDGKKYDLIINDISGIARDISELSPWFNKAPAAPGNLGIELLLVFLEKAKAYLAQEARVIFPLISLSQVNTALNAAENIYNLTLIKEVDWPMPKELTSKISFELVCEKLKIPVKRKFGMLVGTTYIYEGRLK
jgi:SAM-dependent methyltransferase